MVPVNTFIFQKKRQEVTPASASSMSSPDAQLLQGPTMPTYALGVCVAEEYYATACECIGLLAQTTVTEYSVSSLALTSHIRLSMLLTLTDLAM
jgi:hypothetical protein